MGWRRRPSVRALSRSHRSTRCSARRSPSATARTGWSECGFHTSIPQCGSSRITDAEGGAMIWRNARDGIARSTWCTARCRGMDVTLAVHPYYQGQGIGMIVSSGIEWRKAGAKVMVWRRCRARWTNVGFYSTLGFNPGFDRHSHAGSCARRDSGRRQCRPSVPTNGTGAPAMQVTAGSACSGYDYTREIVLTEQHQLGDTLFVGKTTSPLIRHLPFGSPCRGRAT